VEINRLKSRMCHCQDPQPASPAAVPSEVGLEYADEDAEGDRASAVSEVSTDRSYRTPPVEVVEPLRVIDDEEIVPSSRPNTDCCATSVPLPESPLVEIVENEVAIPVPAPAILDSREFVRGQRAHRGKGYSRSFRNSHAMKPYAGDRRRRSITPGSSDSDSVGAGGDRSGRRDLELLDNVVFCPHDESGGWGDCCTARSRWRVSSKMGRNRARYASSPVA
jgi:hypothetical protein